jgi:hypothetical protein
MAKNKALVLIYPTMPINDIKGSINIMLSPQFYTLKKESLPVKYAHQAKKIAPSLFDGLVDDEGAYEYTVIQENDQWVFLAYDNEEIKAFIRSKGIKEEQVDKVFFAQEALNSFTHPMPLGEKEALVVLDNTAVVVPLMALEGKDKPSLKFNNSFTPEKGGVTLKGENDALIEEKDSWMLAAVFALFAGMFLVEGLRSGGEDTSSKAQMQAILEEHPALESSYTRGPELEKYRAIDKIERKKREAIKAFSDFIFKGVILTALDVNDKTFSAHFDCADKKMAKKVQTLAKKQNYIVKINSNNAVEIKGTL